MKPARFTSAPIIGILGEKDAGAKAAMHKLAPPGVRATVKFAM